MKRFKALTITTYFLLFTASVQCSNAVGRLVNLVEVVKNLKSVRQYFPAPKQYREEEFTESSGNPFLGKLSAQYQYADYFGAPIKPSQIGDKQEKYSKSASSYEKKQNRLAEENFMTRAVNIPLADIKQYIQEREARAVQQCFIKVIEIHVLQQTVHNWPQGDIRFGLSWNRVAQGEGGHCGYHALKNVEELMNILGNARFLTSDDYEIVTLLDDFEVYQQFMQKNASAIDQKYRHGGDLSWLNGEELEYLRNLISEVHRKNILIVENVPVRGFEFHETILKAVRQFVAQPKGMLGIVWNAGVRHDVRAMGGVHWVGFVAVKLSDHNNCEIQLYVMDSGGGGGQMYLENVKKLLSKSVADIDHILMAEGVKHMQEDLDTLSNPLRRSMPTLQDVVDLIMVNWKDYEQLPPEIQRQVMTWLEITWPSAEKNEKIHLAKIYKDKVLKKLNMVQDSFRELIAE